MILIGDHKELIMVARKPGSRKYSIVCFGRKAHYRVDGTCKHTAEIVANLKPTVRYAVKPWGGKENTP